MRQEITLKKDTRLFRLRENTENMLLRAGDILEEGDVVTIDDPKRMVYDHRYLYAVPILEGNDIHRWMLVEELDMPELVH